jgi:general secretion pathway protein G
MATSVEDIEEKSRFVSRHCLVFMFGLAIFTVFCLLWGSRVAVAIPLQKRDVASREAELKRNLREIRSAIANYRQACMSGQVGPVDRRVDDKCYPPTLEVLVEGIHRPGDNVKLVFLERIPNDPMTGKADWGLRSAQDPPDSTTWGGQNVANVYSNSKDVAGDGTKYKDW